MHMDSFINCHVVDWRRFLQIDLELIFVKIDVQYLRKFK